MIKRILKVENMLEKGKVLIIYGPRQVGKTTLVQEYLKNTKLNYIIKSGDDLAFRNSIIPSINSVSDFVANFELIFIDEAQKIPDIGLILKILVDQFPNKFVIATGSSSFDLAQATGESLTGRKNVVNLFPVSQNEILQTKSRLDLKLDLEQYLLFGSYPEIITYTTNIQKENRIKEITNAYLLKDILEFDKVKSSKPILSLLKLISFQIGQEVSTLELGNQLDLDSKTISRYLDLLEKSFVLYRLDGFSRNLRKEVTKMSKYYFYDLGIRNSLILNFNQLDTRNDVGQIWENFLVIERLKKQHYKPISSNNYFWRTWDQQKIDFIEERGGKLFGFEFKYSSNLSKHKAFFEKLYPEATVNVINKENYLDFVL